MNFVIFLLNFDEILSEFHEKFQEITKVLNILRNSARKIRKMLEISGICEKFHFFRMKISINSLVCAARYAGECARARLHAEELHAQVEAEAAAELRVVRG